MKGTDPIYKTDDVIDSRDVIARIEELERMRDEAPLDDTEVDEYRALKKLESACEGEDEWTHGLTLIRDTYFAKYAEQLADDIGLVRPSNQKWPYNHIDWEAAAEELKDDYTAYDFDGVTYYAR